MLAESNRPSVSAQSPASAQASNTDALYRSNATVTDRWLQVLQRRKWAIATTALAAAAGVWGWTLTRPTVYEGQVQISADQSESVDDQAAALEPSLLQSAVVLESTADSLASTYPNVSEDVLANSLAIAPRASQSLVVQYQGRSPNEVEAVLAELSQQYQEASDQPVIISSPVVDDRPISPKILKGLLLGAIAGIAVGTAAAVFAEKLDRSFHSPDSLKSFSKLPMLGIIPFFKTLQPTKPGQIARPSTPTVSGMADYETASFLESFRTLYSNLRFLKPNRSVRSLVISSAIPAEGKSTTALNLAKAAAVMGQRVLLVDADLRLPQLHLRLTLPNTVGLSEILSQRLPWQEHLQSALDENLSVLTAGSAPSDPIRLLSSSAMQDLMQTLSDEFDLVIYDTPPLLGFTDSGLVATHTDGMVMVVGLGTTTRVELKQALDSLEVMPVQVLGMVANGIRSHTTQSYSYDRYHRYYAQRALVTAAASAIEASSTAAPATSRVSTQAAIAPTQEPQSQSGLDTTETIESTSSNSSNSSGSLDELSSGAAPVEQEAIAPPVTAETPVSQDDTTGMSEQSSDPYEEEIGAATDPDWVETETTEPMTELFEVSSESAESVLESPTVDSSDSGDRPESNSLDEADSQLSAESGFGAEDEERPSTLFAQVMDEMKALMQTYGSVPRLLQQVTQGNRPEQETHTAEVTQDEEPEAELDLDLEADLDSLDVEPLNLAALSVDAQTTSEDLFLDQAELERYQEETPDESLALPSDGTLDGTEDEADLDAIDLFDAASTSSDFDLMDTPDDSEPQDVQSSFDPFLTMDADDDIALGSEPWDEETNGIGLTISDSDLEHNDGLDELEADGTDTTSELSAEELACLEEEGILESLALPDEPVLEGEAESDLTLSAEEFAIADDDTESFERSEASTFILDSSGADEELEPALSNFESSPLVSDTPDEDMTIADIIDDADRAVDRSEMPTFILDNSTDDITNAGAIADADAHLDRPEQDQNGRSLANGAIASHDTETGGLNDLAEDWASEDSLGEDVTELEEQELEELLAWDTATLSQQVSNQFEQAVLSAQEAIRMGEVATTASDWQALSTHWQQAAEMMGLVPERDPNFDIAQRCKMLYRSNSEYADQKARHVTDSEA